MKEHPILFSGEMVRAILDGHKTMTRRVIKPQFSKTWGSGVRNQDPEHFSVHVDIKEPDGNWKWLRCPYGKVGDRLWVRETWAAISPDEEWRPIKECNIEYKADSPYANYPGDWPDEEAKGNEDAPKWRPSIHMPRWASRLTLEIVGVKVERVQDISQADMEAEGLASFHFVRGMLCDDWHPQKAFADLWDSINAKRGFGWDTNPFVWVVEFRKV